MLKRSTSRNQRSRGVKVKHVLQIVVLLGICFWLIYQIKYSHDKRKELSGKDMKLSNTEHISSDVVKRGRKELNPRVEEIGGKNEKQIDKEEEEEDKHEERETEVEEGLEEEMGKPEVEETKEQEDEQEGEEKEHEVEEEEKEHQLEEEEDAKGDEIEDQDKLLDEVDREEDFIDEEKEREEDSSVDKETAEDNGEEEEEEEKHGQVEDENQNLDEDEAHDEVDRSTHGAREEHYKGDDASSAVTHDNNQLIGLEAKKLNLAFANDTKIATNTSNQFNDEDKNESEPDGKKLEMADKGLNLKDTGAEGKDNVNGTGAAKVLEDSPPQNLTVSTENNGAKVTISGMNTEDLSTSPPNGTETTLHSPQVQNSTIDGVDKSNTMSDGKEADTVLQTPNAGSMVFSNSTGAGLGSAISDEQLHSDEKGSGGNIRLPSTKKENNTQSQDSMERQNESDEIKAG